MALSHKIFSPLLLALGLFFGLDLPLHAATISQTLYLNRGTLTTVDTTVLPALAWNDNAVFSPRSIDIVLSPGDSLILNVLNNDTAAHTFTLNGGSLPLAAGQNGQLNLHFPNRGVYIFHDSEAFPGNAKLGATGMVVVDGPCDGRFFWNVWEIEQNANIAFANGQPVNWASYHPDYFLVNGLSKPALENDPTAKIIGNVGDTLRIYIANTGFARHSMHFHGYHLVVKWSSTGTRKLNWSKDTVPLERWESMILELIPDKPGIFPVHDHNLLAITGGGYFPNGIFIMMNIQ